VIVKCSDFKFEKFLDNTKKFHYFTCLCLRVLTFIIFLFLSNNVHERLPMHFYNLVNVGVTKEDVEGCPLQAPRAVRLVNGVFSWAVGTFDVVVDLRSGKQKLPKFVSDFDFANCVFNFKFSSERPLQIFWVSESFVKAWLRSDCNVNINIFFFSR